MASDPQSSQGASPRFYGIENSVFFFLSLSLFSHNSILSPNDIEGRGRPTVTRLRLVAQQSTVALVTVDF